MVNNMVGQAQNTQMPQYTQGATSPAFQTVTGVQPVQPANPQTAQSTPVQQGTQATQGSQYTQLAQNPNLQVPNYSGVNIQIFNPSVAGPGGTVPASNVNAPTYTTAPASYPQNYYTQNLAQPKAEVKEVEPEKPKTEKREVVQITDDYVKNVESYLNNQDKQIRLTGAKEVLARLHEDPSRKNDPALNALINKMLQDPYQPIKFMAMAALESGEAKGDAKSVQLLQVIQNQTSEKNKMSQEDSLKASNALLKMSSNTVKKEFEVDESKSKKESKKA